MDNRAFLDFLSIIAGCKTNTRHCFLPSGRQESVADHSWRLSVMALLLSEEIDGVDMNRVIKMCLIHDFGEAVTGDIPSFLKSDSDIDREDGEVDALVAALPVKIRGELAECFAQMRELSTPEARVWRALDMMEAVISHNESNLSSWLELEYELQQTYGVDEAQIHPVLAALRAQVLADTRKKIAEK